MKSKTSCFMLLSLLSGCAVPVMDDDWEGWGGAGAELPQDDSDTTGNGSGGSGSRPGSASGGSSSSGGAASGGADTESDETSSGGATGGGVSTGGTSAGGATSTGGSGGGTSSGGTSSGGASASGGSSASGGGSATGGGAATGGSSAGGCGGLAAWATGSYSGGALVQHEGKKYECKPHPYSGWCGMAAYEPGGSSTHPDAWKDAWIDRGSCE